MLCNRCIVSSGSFNTNVLLNYFRNRQTIGRRFVEISAATRVEYYDAVVAVSESGAVMSVNDSFPLLKVISCNAAT